MHENSLQQQSTNTMNLFKDLTLAVLCLILLF